MRKIRLLTLAALIFAVFSCSNDNETDEPISNEEIDFTISFSNSMNFKNGDLSKSTQTLDDAKTIVLTIKTISGVATKYTAEKIDIYKMGDNFFSQKLSLQSDDYKLTEFFLLDSSENVIYATPLTGSLQAQNVENPLPIEFSISKDQITYVFVEVLSTENLTPADFGLVGFIFSEVPTFSFFLKVTEKGQTDSILTSTLLISSGTYSYSQNLTTIDINTVTLKDGFPEYTLKISNSGYLDFEKIFAVDSLKKYNMFPLIIELEKIANETVTDIDGNIYNTVKIGNQIWMAENLKVTKYRNGEPIPTGPINIQEWSELTTPAYSWDIFNSTENEYKNVYGLLYNWAAVVDSSNICPVGWHIPSDEEWTELSNYIGGIANKLKATGSSEAGNGLWVNPNDGGTNETGFTALPGGGREISGMWTVGGSANWWSSTEIDANNAWSRGMNSSTDLIRYIFYCSKINGFSVRCIKD